MVVIYMGPSAHARSLLPKTEYLESLCTSYHLLGALSVKAGIEYDIFMTATMISYSLECRSYQ